MKKYYILPLLLAFSFTPLQSQQEFFSPEYQSSIQQTAQQTLSSASSLEPNELQLLANFLCFYYKLSAQNIELRHKLQPFLAVTVAITSCVDTHKKLKDSAAPELVLSQLEEALKQRDQTYDLWCNTEKKLEEQGSPDLTNIMDTIRNDGQEAILCCINKHKKAIISTINKLYKEGTLIDPYRIINTAINSLRLLTKEEGPIPDGAVLEIMHIASDAYLKAGSKSVAISAYLNRSALLAEECSKYFYGVYYEILRQLLEKMYPENATILYEIKSDRFQLSVGDPLPLLEL